MATDGPGTLKASFVYPEMISRLPPAIRELCPEASAQAFALGGIATDVVVGLAGKAAESLIDAAALKTQQEATLLEVTVPLAGFFNERGEIAVGGGCLIFHNADKEDLSDASLLGSLVLVPSFDRSAFRFSVNRWKFDRFLKPQSSNWFQQSERRDFLLKIEFLTPGSENLGTRSVYVEHKFDSANVAALKTALSPGQELPWFSSPGRPEALPVASPTNNAEARYMPLNIRVTAVETTRPNKFATWLRDMATEKKAGISTAVMDAVKKSLDPNYAATERVKQADAASTAFAAYKTSWDEAATHHGSRPKDPAATATQPEREKFTADLQAWRATMSVKIQLMAARCTLARSEFASAELAWPGDLPAFKPL